MKPAATLLWSIAVCLTFDGAAFAADPRATLLRYQPWTKFCIGSSCFVSIEARGQCMPCGGWVVFALEDGKPVSLSSSFFTKKIRNPASLRIDDGDPILVPNQPCLPSGLCINKLAIDDSLIAQLKRAQTVTIEATEMTGEKLSLSFSLADFAHVYDGPGHEPEVRKEIRSREEMKEMVEREEAEKRERECKE